MSKTHNSKPLEDGYRMPAEFEPHRGCWMLWPERGDTWRLGAKPAQANFVKVAEAISGFEPVTVGVSHRQWENARAVLPDNVRVVEISSNDAWMRDVGPTFVIDDGGHAEVSTGSSMPGAAWTTASTSPGPRTAW